MHRPLDPFDHKTPLKTIPAKSGAPRDAPPQIDPEETERIEQRRKEEAEKDA